MQNLRTLDISFNKNLTKIDEKILNLKHLYNLNCGGCFKLISPPYGVYQQGLTAIKSFFEDLASGQQVELTIVPVSVVGHSMSGKTSLIRSLQSRSRVLTKRSETNMLDETTKVFKIEGVQLDNSYAKMIDHGGHEVYHITYRYILKERNIPLIVVNLNAFKSLAKEKGKEAATEELCWQWLAHIYLACPSLVESPFLVLTHSDEVSDLELQSFKDCLFNHSKQLRDEMLNVEQLPSRVKKQVLHKTKFLSNKGVEVFNEENTFVFGKESHQIEDLRKALDFRCMKYKVFLPQKWNDMCNFVEKSLKEPVVTVSEVLASFPGERSMHILGYMHNIGDILWFQSVESLKGYIFRDIPAMTEMISILFHHKSDHLWVKRAKKFCEFDFNGRFISFASYQQLVKEFTRNGILDEALLSHLLKSESRFPPDIAIELLKSFWIVQGPIVLNAKQNKNGYAIPYFAQESIDEMWKKKHRIQLWLNVKLSGLPLPNYGFQLMTVAVLNELSSNINRPKVFANGAIVNHDGLELHLVHDAPGQITTIQVASKKPHFGGLWKQLEKATGSILKLLSTVWPASWSDICVFCGHCLFLREPSPEETFNPDWFCQVGDTLTVERCSGVLELVCEKDDEQNVLSALVRPCHQLDEEKIRIIQKYLNTLLERSAATEKVVAPVRQQHIEELATPVQPQQNEDSIDTTAQVVAHVRQQHAEGLAIAVQPLQDEDSIDMHPVTPVSQPATEGLAISVQLQQSENSQSDSELSDTLDQASEDCTVKLCSKSSVKDLYHSDYVYRMSTMRGRCLLINNITFTYPNGTSDNREGSALDGQRILFLFRQLRFLCFSEENLSSQRMLEVIRNETGRHADENYGMFVLVIMSHGSETGISGTDGRMVQRTDINNALSAQNFPAMARKPKLLIIQACSGGLQDRVVLDSQPATSSPHPGSSLPSVSGLPTNEVPSSSTMTLPLSTPITSSVWMHPAGSHAVLETDDLLIWEASFRGHMAYRHPRYGSWFITAVVESLSKHACHRDLKTLFDKQIRKKVRKRSIQHGEGQQPDMSCTLQKKLFLFPGYNPPDPE